MRLQSAIFYLEETLLAPGCDAVGAEKLLSLLKMESVWLAAVSKINRSEAEEALRERRLLEKFRFLLPQAEAYSPIDSEEILIKAMRRLHSQKVDTVIFCATLRQVETAKAAGFRAVAVKGREAEWDAMRECADYALERYDDWFTMDNGVS